MGVWVSRGWVGYWLPTGIISSHKFLLLIPVWAFISNEVGYSCQAWKGGFVGLSGVRLVIGLPTGIIYSKNFILLIPVWAFISM